MLCLQFTAPNVPPCVIEAPDPVPADGEVLVLLRAAALNHRDLWIQLGKYPGVTYPIVPGSDGAGIVLAAAPGQESWIGKHVVINPACDWGGNDAAQARSFSILGSPRQGTLATHITVPVSQLIVKPEHLSWHEAAALPLAGLTAWRALMRQGAATRESRVLITGIGGGVALATLGFAHALGCRIAVTTSHATKQQRALELGAELALDRADSSWPQQLEIYWNGGADIVIDGAGGEGLNLLLDALKPGGTLVVYGATAGVPQQLDLRKVFWRQQRIQGSTMGSPTDWVQMMAAVNRDRIRPSIDSVRPLKHAAEALTRMQAGQQFGKLVINCD